MKRGLAVGAALLFVSGILTACGEEAAVQEPAPEIETTETEVESGSSAEPTVFGPHEGLNQPAAPVKMEWIGEHEVNIEMTAQITDIEIAPDLFYKAWTFNGEAPGPLLIVNEGDMINFKLKNLDPAVPHSIDLHAVHAAPSVKFANIMPNEEGIFSYAADDPGVFMYHCGTDPVLAHIANGMHGTIIVKPADGYPTDSEIDREFVMIQNEWYKYNDMEDFENGEPSQVVFSAKALNEGDRNTNGDTFSLKNEPLTAKAGEKVRIYINNMGPNEVSSFHVVGTVLDDVYIDGNPGNHMTGMQTVLLPASGGAVVEFTVTEVGDYPIVTHQFNHASKGAVAKLRVLAE